jgi:hypothetical protein
MPSALALLGTVLETVTPKQNLAEQKPAAAVAEQDDLLIVMRGVRLVDRGLDRLRDVIRIDIGRPAVAIGGDHHVGGRVGIPNQLFEIGPRGSPAERRTVDDQDLLPAWRGFGFAGSAEIEISQSE